MSKKTKKTSEEVLEEALVPEEEYPYKVPRNWGWFRIKEFIETMETREPKKLEGGLFHYIDVDAIDNKTQSVREVKKLEIASAPSRAKRKVSMNDVIISLVRPYLKNIAQINEDDKKLVASTAFYVCTTKDILVPNYLYNYLCSNYPTKYLIDNTKGDNSPSVRSTDFEKMPIPIPPLNEQKRIAEKVKRLLNKIEQAKQLVEEAKGTFKLRRAATLNKAFRGVLTEKWRSFSSDDARINSNKISEVYEAPFSIPNSWKWVELQNIMQMQNGLSKRKGTSGELIPVLRLADINQYKFSNEDFREILLTNKEIEKYKVKNDDLLFIRVNGSFDMVGKAIRFNLGREAAFCDHLIRGTVDKEVNSSYLEYLFRSSIIRNQLVPKIVSSAGQNTVSQGSLGALFIPLPPKDEQDEIVRILECILNKEDNINSILNSGIHFNDLKQSVLTKAFRGELGTNDPTEESAIELLKQLLEEKL